MVSSGKHPNNPADRKIKKKKMCEKLPWENRTQNRRLEPFFDVWWVRGYFGPSKTQGPSVLGSQDPGSQGTRVTRKERKEKKIREKKSKKKKRKKKKK